MQAITMTCARSSLCVAILALALAGACTTSGGSGDGDGDELGCAPAASYTELPAQEAEQDLDDEGDPYYALYAELDSGETLNELEVSLWTGVGAFTDEAIAPGTYTIAGDETNYDDCGVCVTIYGDVDAATDQERQLLMAQSGTVVIDSLTGTLSGSLSDVVLQEVDPLTSAPVAGGCQSRIGSASFSAPIEVP